MQGGDFVYTFTFISSLPCLHTLWGAIPTSFYISNDFHFLYYKIMEYVVILVARHCGTRVQLHRTTREVVGPDHILTYNHDAAGHNTKHMTICR